MIDVNVSIDGVLVNCDDSIQGINFGRGYNLRKIELGNYEFRDRLVDGRGQLDIKYMSSRLQEEGKIYFWDLHKEDTYSAELPAIQSNVITDESLKLPAMEVYKDEELAYIHKRIALLHLFKAGNIGYNEIFLVHKYKIMGFIGNTQNQTSTNATRNFVDERRYTLTADEVIACNTFLSEHDGTEYDLMKSCIDEFVWGLEQIDIPTGFEQFTTALEMILLEKDCSYKKVCLAKRTAVLIGTDDSEINSIYQKMLNFYRYRSESLHEGDGGNISLQELMELEGITRQVLNKYLDICKNEIISAPSKTWELIKANQIILLKSLVTNKIGTGVLPE